MAQVEHLVKHRVGEAFHPRNAVANFTNHTHILLARREFALADLSFNLL